MTAWNPPDPADHISEIGIVFRTVDPFDADANALLAWCNDGISPRMQMTVEDAERMSENEIPF
jgi:hypothetical protein